MECLADVVLAYPMGEDPFVFIHLEVELVDGICHLGEEMVHVFILEQGGGLDREAGDVFLVCLKMLDKEFTWFRLANDVVV